MKKSAEIAIIGDFTENRISQFRTNRAIEETADFLSVKIEKEWIPTMSITGKSPGELGKFDGIWAGPGDYENPDGAISAIKFSRINNIPFLGT